MSFHIVRAEPVDISVNASNIPNHNQSDVYAYMNHFSHNLHDTICFSFVNLIDVDEERSELLVSSYNRLSYVFFVIPRIIKTCLCCLYVGFGISLYYIGPIPTLAERQYHHH